MKDQDWGNIFQALSDKYRRQLLILLDEVNEEWIDPLDEEIYPENYDVPSRIALVHSHLPHLDEKDYIDLNETNYMIRKGSKWGKN
jgi:hypothetical protein